MGHSVVGHRVGDSVDHGVSHSVSNHSVSKTMSSNNTMTEAMSNSVFCNNTMSKAMSQAVSGEELRRGRGSSQQGGDASKGLKQRVGITLQKLTISCTFILCYAVVD